MSPEPLFLFRFGDPSVRFDEKVSAHKLTIDTVAEMVFFCRFHHGGQIVVTVLARNQVWQTNLVLRRIGPEMGVVGHQELPTTPSDILQMIHRVLDVPGVAVEMKYLWTWKRFNLEDFLAFYLLIVPHLYWDPKGEDCNCFRRGA